MFQQQIADDTDNEDYRQAPRRTQSHAPR